MTETTATTGTPATAGEGTDTPTSSRRIELHVSEDQVQIYLNAQDPLDDVEESARLIHEACEELKLPEFPEVEALRDYLQQVATPGEDLIDEPFIMGCYATPAHDGRLVWSREFFRDGWVENKDTGAVNFWEPLERRSVSEGEEICRLIPPIAGKTGLTVFDQPITVRKPRAEKLRSGKNVEATDLPDDTRVFTATCDGRVQFAVGTVTVDDVYIIKGDVCLETGNVYHTGSVQIQGDVKAGALIDVGGDVIIQGLVEPSTIKCGGNLNVNGGIVGDGTGTVDAAGNVQALYINEATVRSEGDVVVKNEISHTDVFTLGQVLSPEGRIAGGHIVALRGIRVGMAGASGSTGTVLAAGVDPTLDERISRLRSELPRLAAIRSRLRKALMRPRMERSEMTDEHKTAADTLREKIEQVDAATEQVALDVEQIRSLAAEAAVEKICILKELWSGTTVQLGDLVLTIRKSVHKPRRVRRKGHDLMVLPMAEGAGAEDG